MKVDELKRQMDARFDEVDARFNEVDARFNAVDARFNAVDARFNAVDERFERVDARFDALEARVEDLSAETRRHFDMIAEQLRADIAVLATGLASMSSTLERSMAERGTVLSALDDHEVWLTALERRRQ